MTDYILRGGTVIDGTGGARRRADVAISGDRIAAVGEVAKATGAREIDVSGKIIAPGFIDVHTHADSIADTPRAESTATSSAVNARLASPSLFTAHTRSAS